MFYLDGELVGLVEYYFDGDVVVIFYIEIDFGCRGGGLGVELVVRVLDYVWV